MAKTTPPIQIEETHHVSRSTYEVSSSSKEMFCQLFPAVAESICEDIVSLKLFVIECITKTGATVEPKKNSLKPKNVPKGDAMLLICHVSFQNCLLEVYVDENTCFCKKSFVVSKTTKSTQKTMTELSFLQNVMQYSYVSYTKT